MNSLSSLSLFSSRTTRISSSPPTPLVKSTNRSHALNLKVSSPRRNNLNANSLLCCFKQKKTPEITGFGFPLSLRIIKMKRNLAMRAPEKLPLSLDMSVIKSISTLLLTFEEFLKFKYKGDPAESPVRVSGDMSDSFILLVKKLLFQSPILFFGVLNSIAHLFVFSVENNLPKNMMDQTQIMYEIVILNEPENSLMLCNYAKFLYEIADDNDKAEDLLKRAVKVKPADAEAMCQYGIFLWRKRGNMEAAEEAFIAAMEAEPENPFYGGAYARFTWLTGASDTCYPLEPSTNG